MKMQSSPGTNLDWLLKDSRIYKDRTMMIHFLQWLDLKLSYYFFLIDHRKRFKVFQINVKISFLHGDLQDEVFLKQLPSFKLEDIPDHVYILDKEI